MTPGGKVPEMLRTYENLYADLSAGSGLTAISRDPDFGKAFLIEFQDRLLFGRDYFDTRLMDFLQEVDLPEDVFDKITYKNAQKLLGETVVVWFGEKSAPVRSASDSRLVVKAPKPQKGVTDVNVTVHRDGEPAENSLAFTYASGNPKGGGGNGGGGGKGRGRQK